MQAYSVVLVRRREGAEELIAVVHHYFKQCVPAIVSSMGWGTWYVVEQDAYGKQVGRKYELKEWWEATQASYEVDDEVLFRLLFNGTHHFFKGTVKGIYVGGYRIRDNESGWTYPVDENDTFKLPTTQPEVE